MQNIFQVRIRKILRFHGWLLNRPIISPPLNFDCPQSNRVHVLSFLIIPIACSAPASSLIMTS